MVKNEKEPNNCKHTNNSIESHFHVSLFFYPSYNSSKFWTFIVNQIDSKFALFYFNRSIHLNIR